jgi:hypothetical protein
MPLPAQRRAPLPARTRTLAADRRRALRSGAPDRSQASSHRAAPPRSAGERAAARRERRVALAGRNSDGTRCKSRCRCAPAVWLYSAIFAPASTRTHVRRPICPEPALRYEHMFPHRRKSPFAQRALDALRLTRSFLLLEDDYRVDWEVDGDERVLPVHPHRAPLRGRAGERRPGRPAPAEQVCLSPVGARACARGATTSSARVPREQPRKEPARAPRCARVGSDGDACEAPGAARPRGRRLA